MPLTPPLPPGRASRKALRFTAEIIGLRRQGYTFSAIRAALLDAGLEVSLTTIKREAARAPALAAASRQSPSSERPGPPTPGPLNNEEPAAKPWRDGSRSGRDEAEAFFSTHLSNPLFPRKETP